MANCTAANAQYTTMATCLGSCAAFTQGAAGAQTGNNLECRNYHAGAASGNATLHCPHAGPAGDGACGSNCESFCTIVQNACMGANQQYNNLNACTTACAGFANNTVHYTDATTSGNNYACRVYHVTVAATVGGGQATAHCPHVGATPTAGCN